MRLSSAEKLAGTAPSLGRLLSSVDLRRYDALLFDLDGTLVDTMPLHHRAYAEVLLVRGAELTFAAFLAATGAPAREAIPLMLRSAGISSATSDEVMAIHHDKKTAFARILRSHAPVALPASRLLMAAVGEKKLAVVSSGNRDGVLAILATMGWKEFFEEIISGDDVVNGKPNPEPYLKAAAALGVAAARCLVLEDAEAGLASGRAAGMSVVDVTGFK